MHSANCYVVLLYIRADMQIWTVSLALKKLRIIEFCKFSFYSSHVWMWELGHKKKLSSKQSILLNCGAGGDLRIPWTARRSNQSILKEISSGYSLEELMLKLKLQQFGQLMWRTDSLGKTLMLGKIEGKRKGGISGWDGWMPTQWRWTWANSGR